MSKLLIKGGTAVFADRCEVCDILVDGKKIVKIAKNVDATNNGHFSIFCRTMASIIVAIGITKINNNSVSIKPPSELLIFMSRTRLIFTFYFYYILCLHYYFCEFIFRFSQPLCNFYN